MVCRSIHLLLFIQLPIETLEERRPITTMTTTDDGCVWVLTGTVSIMRLWLRTGEGVLLEKSCLSVVHWSACPLLAESIVSCPFQLNNVNNSQQTTRRRQRTLPDRPKLTMDVHRSLPEVGRFPISEVYDPPQTMRFKIIRKYRLNNDLPFNCSN